MPKFDLVLSYDNLDIENFDHVSSILDHVPNAELWSVDADTRLRATVDARTAGAAVEHLVREVRKGCPRASAHKVELTLWSISEIAAVVDLNREAVRLWTVGKRGPGAFPPPLDTLGERTKVWAAADVWDWLSKHSLPRTEGRPLAIHEVVDGTRALEQFRRASHGFSNLTHMENWRSAKHERVSVAVQRPRNAM